MSGEYTPGPWMTAGGASFTEVPCADGERRGRLAANVYHEGRPGFAIVRVGAITDEVSEVMANTRLVAAAPDLLEALKSVVYAFGMNNAEPQEMARAIGVQMEKASAAIKKAEGAA